MEVFDIQKQLDIYYRHNQLNQAYEFLLIQTQEAMEKGDDLLVLMLLSELIGYYRVTAQFSLGHSIANQAYKILCARGLENSIHGATTYLNIATLLRAEGKYQDALSLYHKTEKIYQELLDEKDERYSAFYNNVSLLYQELGDYQKAIEYEMKALNIVQSLDDCEIETAITYTNLSQMYFSIHELKQGKEYLDLGIALFEEYGPLDPHYFAAMSSLAYYYVLLKDYHKALSLYDVVLNKIEHVFGKNKDYQTVLLNKRNVEEMMNKPLKGLDICQKYYETYGQKMIEEQFKDYQKYMAIGICGFGSDCLGYDDEISHDHDFGPGFCIWLPRDIYQLIGKDLQKAYDALPKEFMGLKRHESMHGQGRVGVFIIEDFFHQFLQHFPQTLSDWLYCDENALLLCTNGRIFNDYYGEISRIRDFLEYYPEDIRIKKIARAVAKIAQSGQYNYSRCMQRHDEVAASLALNEFIEQTLSCIYLLNKKYKPYYKWSFYGLKDCTKLRDIQPMIAQLVTLPSQREQWEKPIKPVNTQDQKVVLIEKICQKMITELHVQGLTDHYDDFLDNHTFNIMNRINAPIIRSKHIMEG